MRNIIFGVIFIILGASGGFVFRGTNSSALLVIAGVVSLIIGIVRLVGENSTETKTVQPEMTERQKMFSVCKACTNRKFDMKTGTTVVLPAQNRISKECAKILLLCLNKKDS